MIKLMNRTRISAPCTFFSVWLYDRPRPVKDGKESTNPSSTKRPCHSEQEYFRSEIIDGQTLSVGIVSLPLTFAQGRASSNTWWEHLPAQVELGHFPEACSCEGYSAISARMNENEAEKILRQSEEWLRLAIQAGKMYAYEWDVTSDVLVRSPEYLNVLTATEPRTLTHQQALERIHPDDRPKLLAAIARHSPENPTVEVTYRVLLPGKPPVWVKSSGRAFFDKEGRMLRVLGMVADVTDQKLAEEALRVSEERRCLAQKAAGIGAFERCSDRMYHLGRRTRSTLRFATRQPRWKDTRVRQGVNSSRR
jgi:PAS domain-containing protein